MITIQQFIEHAINRDYMSGVERDANRIKATAEVFTPDELVTEILEKLSEYNPEAFTDTAKTFLDPSCGDGQFLAWVILYKLINGEVGMLDYDDVMNMDVSEEFEAALRTTFGVDLMPDNVAATKNRLLSGQEHLRHIVDMNIVCANALTYDFSFTGTQ